MKNILILILTIATITGCSNDNGIVNIRLSNISNLNFENIVVNTYDRNVNYGNLNSGEFSDYKKFKLAYRYAYVELLIVGETYKFLPIDYMGETPLEEGSYTYQINVINYPNQYRKLRLTLIED